MQTQSLLDTLTEKVISLLVPNPTHFLVEIRIKPTNNIKVFIDADEGIILSSLIRYNRQLYTILEESELFPGGDFSLEVSSPGLDEPLKQKRQYSKNIGRFVHITKNDLTEVEGKLLAATDESVTIETESGKGKKKEIAQTDVLFDDIKTTKIQIRF